jgi:uncharacterized protein with FMN-binding domain
MRSRFLIAIMSLALIFFLSGCVFSEMTDFAANTVIKTPDLSLITDGSYQGDCASGIVSASVEIQVANHSISAFKILKQKHGPGHSAEALAQKVIEKQSLEVDAVSGSTVSSKVVLKAAEKALNSGIPK